MKTKPLSDKNRLIKKHCEGKSSSSYRDALGLRQAGRGIYVLYRKGEVYYIGLSKRSIRARLRSHATKDRHKGKWDKYSFYQVRRARYVKDIESLLLRIFRPRGNRIIGRFKKKYSLSK